MNLRDWPGINTHLLVNLIGKICNGGDPLEVDGFSSRQDCPPPRRHTHDEGVWIGLAARLEKLPDGVDTVVSLRAVGATVFLHGTGTHCRVPAVAALCGARRAGIGVHQALDDVSAEFPDADLTGPR